MAETEIAQSEKTEEKVELQIKEADEFSEIGKVGEEVLSASAVFGVSEEEIEVEYKTFKAKKLFKKIEVDATAVCGDDGIVARAEECLNYGFGGMVVLPQYISVAKKKLGGNGVEVIGAVSFPYGEEIPYTTVKSAKKAAAKGADTLLVPVGVSLIKRGMTDTIKQTFKKIVKKAKCKVCACLECSALTSEEIEKIVKTLTGVGVTSFRSSTGVKPCADEITCLKNIRSALKSGNEVTAYSDYESGGNAVRLLSEANKLATKMANQIADDIKKRLKIQ